MFSKVNIKAATNNSEVVDYIIKLERDKHTGLKVKDCNCIVCSKKRNLVAKKIALHRFKSYVDRNYDVLQDVNKSLSTLEIMEQELEDLKDDLDSWSKLMVL